MLLAIVAQISAFFNSTVGTLISFFIDEITC